jgi:hypothetical protein
VAAVEEEAEALERKSAAGAVEVPALAAEAVAPERRSVVGPEQRRALAVEEAVYERRPAEEQEPALARWPLAPALNFAGRLVAAPRPVHRG